MTFKYRPVHISSSLRPDYYEFFPSFSDLELVERFKTYPSLRATAFMIPNIRRSFDLGLCEIYDTALLLKDRDYSRKVFCEYLVQIGVNERAVCAIESIDREAFIPFEFHHIQWINESIPFTDATWISAPGIVSLMLDMVARGEKSYSNIVEIGCGTGFHLACIREMFPDAQLTGIEANLEAVEYARRVLSGKDVEVMHRTDIPSDVSPDFVFCTFHVSEKSYRRLRKKFPDTDFQVPVDLDKQDIDFAVRLHKQYMGYVNFDEFKKSNIVIQKIIFDIEGSNEKSLYDVRFVREVESMINKDTKPSLTDISKFRDMMRL